MNPHSAKHHRILSPARLPVPPLRLMLHISESEKSITKLRYVVNIPPLKQLTFEELTPKVFVPPLKQLTFEELTPKVFGQ